MVNKKKLYSIMYDKGFDKMELVNMLSMAESTYYRKINGEAEFKVSDIDEFIKILNLTPNEVNDIFFS